jgi:4-amino-4-deoxychorismate mutase
MEPVLTQLRAQLDEIDALLVEIVGRRFRICGEIAHVKQQHAIPMMQTDRIRAVKTRAANLAIRHGVAPELTDRLFDLLIEEACRLETNILEQVHHAPPGSGAAG